MATSKPNLAELIAKLPEPDRPGQASKFTGPAPETATQLFEEVLAGSPASLSELVALVRDPSDPDFSDYRAGYLLHGLVIHVGAPGKEKARRQLVQALLAALTRKESSPALKVSFIRELQVVGGSEAIQGLSKNLLDETLGEPCAQALVLMGEEAIGAVRTAAGQAKGRSRLVLLHALAQLRDQKSAKLFRAALEDAEADVVVTAAWALARIGAGEAISDLLRVSDKAEGWVRVQTTHASVLLAENLAAAGRSNDAGRIYAHLVAQRKEPSEQHFAELAQRRLKAGNAFGF